MNHYPQLLKDESVLEAAEELLFRQVTKHQWDEINEIPSSTAFGPMPIDDGRPSYAREGAGVSAQSARDWHQDHAKSPSLGVWAVTTLEVDSAGLRAVDDSACPLSPGEERAPGHAYVDFRGLGRKERTSARAELLLRAMARGELPTSDKLAV